MKKNLFLFTFIFCIFSQIFAEPQNGVVYVKYGATGTGASWSDAMGNIQDAIAKAREDKDLRKDVWVAGGEFTISTTISLVDSVNVYGSFAGNETSVNERSKIANGKEWEFSNPTILNGDNVRILHATGHFDMPTIVDGFIMQGGNGVSTAALNGHGGAVLTRGNVVIQNCIIRNNSVSNGAGGGVHMTGGTVRYCLIENNSQSTNANGGGGVYSNPAAGNPSHIEYCTIRGNSSSIRGGGLNIQGGEMTYLTGLEIYNNTAINTAGATVQGAGIFANSLNNEIINCAIFNNTGSNTVRLQTMKFANNTVVKNIGGIYIASGTATSQIKNNIVWACVTDATLTTATSVTGVAVTNMQVQNNATYNPISTTNNWSTADNIQFSSNVSNGDVEEPAENTVGSGPKFVKVSSFIGAIDPTGLSTEDVDLLNAELEDVDWSLNMTSPCVDMGQNLDYVASDILGENRPQGFPLETAKTDIGAYELPFYTIAFADYNSALGSVYDDDGNVMTPATLFSMGRGAELMLYFISENGELPFSVTIKRSENGGLTFDGEATDITSELNQDGLWTTKVFFPFKVTVVWKKETGVNTVNADNIYCYGKHNSIEFKNITIGDMVKIFSSNGLLINTIKATSTNFSISLPKGVYIVQSAGQTQKLVVK